MPLAYEERTPLTIPADAFADDDLARIVVQGGRYGGEWNLIASVLTPGSDPQPIGEIMTAADDRPEMAVDTAQVWLNDACGKAGLKLAHFESKNDSYGPAEAPFFAAAFALVDRR